MATQDADGTWHGLVPISPAVTASPLPSEAVSIGHHAIGSAIPATAGVAGAITGGEAGGTLGSAFGPIGTAVGGVGGALLGGLGLSALAGSAQQAVLDANPSVAQALGQSDEQRAAEESAHPVGSFIGGLLPQAAFMRPGGAVFDLLKGGEAAGAAAAKIGLGAAAMGGIEAGQEYANTGTVDPTKVAISAAAGGVLNEPYGLGKAMHNFATGDGSMAGAEESTDAVQPSNLLQLTGPDSTPQLSDQRGDEAINIGAQRQITDDRPPLAAGKNLITDANAPVDAEFFDTPGVGQGPNRAPASPVAQLTDQQPPIVMPGALKLPPPTPAPDVGQGDNRAPPEGTPPPGIQGALTDQRPGVAPVQYGGEGAPLTPTTTPDISFSAKDIISRLNNAATPDGQPAPAMPSKFASGLGIQLSAKLNAMDVAGAEALIEHHMERAGDGSDSYSKPQQAQLAAAIDEVSAFKKQYADILPKTEPEPGPDLAKPLDPTVGEPGPIAPANPLANIPANDVAADSIDHTAQAHAAYEQGHRDALLSGVLDNPESHSPTAAFLDVLRAKGHDDTIRPQEGDRIARFEQAKDAFERGGDNLDPQPLDRPTDWIADRDKALGEEYGHPEGQQPAADERQVVEPETPVQPARERVKGTLSAKAPKADQAAAEVKEPQGPAADVASAEPMTDKQLDEKIDQLFRDGKVTARERNVLKGVQTSVGPDGKMIPVAEANAKIDALLSPKTTAADAAKTLSDSFTAPKARAGGDAATQPIDRAKVMAAARAELDKVGLHHVGVELHDSLPDGNAGSYHDGLIKLSMDQSPQSIQDTLHHEMIHGLRDAGAYTKAEWKTLTEAANRHSAANTFGDEHYAHLAPEARNEEKVAELFAHSFKQAPEPASFVGRMFKRFKDVLGAIGKAVTKSGPSADDILAKTRSGEIGNREMADAPATSGGVKARKMTPEQTADEAMKKTPDDIMAGIGDRVGRFMMNLKSVGQIAEGEAAKRSPIAADTERLYDSLGKASALKSTLEAAGTHVDEAWAKLPSDHAQALGEALLNGSLKEEDLRTTGGRILKDGTDAEEAAAKKVYGGVLDAYRDQKDAVMSFMRDQINSGPGTDEEKVAEIKLQEGRFSKTAYFPLYRFGDFINIAKNAEFGRTEDALEAAKMEHDRVSKATGTTTEQLKAAQDAVSAAREAHEKSASMNYAAPSYETKEDQLAGARDLKAKGFEVNSIKKRDYQPHLHGPGTAFLAKYDAALHADSQANPSRKAGNDALSVMMHGLMATMQPEGSALRTSLYRKGVAGYSTDARRVFSATSRLNAGFIAALQNGEKQRGILADMDASIDRANKAPGADTTRVTDVRNQLNKQYNILQKYVKTPVQEVLSNMTYAYMLGGSPSFAVMHSMQTLMVTHPMLSAFFNPMRVTGELMKAASEVGSHVGDLKEGNEAKFAKTPGEAANLRFAMERATIQSTNSAGFRAVGDNMNPAQRVGHVIMEGASFLPHYIEKFNRVLTLNAAYRMAVDSPKIGRMLDDAHYNNLVKDSPWLADHTRQEVAAMWYANKMTVDSHVDYGGQNAPYAMQPGVLPMGKLMTQFQKYQQAMIYQLVKNSGAMFDKTLSAEERIVAAKTLFGVVGTHALLTGAMGLPGYGIAALALNAYHKAVGDKDDPFEADDAFHQFLNQHLGKDVGDVVGRGLLYAPGVRNVLPADITDRLGMGDLVASPKALGTGVVDRDSVAQYIGTALGGPAGSLLGQFADAANAAHQGDDWKAAELMMPKVLRDISRTIRFQQQGVTTSSNNPVVKPGELSLADLATQAMGFTPQKVEEAYANKASVMDAKAEMDLRRKVLLKEFTDAMTSGDTDKAAAMRDKITAYNAEQSARGVYSERINGSEMMRSVQQRRLAGIRLNNGVALSPKDRGLINEYSVQDPADSGQ